MLQIQNVQLKYFGLAGVARMYLQLVELPCTLVVSIQLASLWKESELLNEALEPTVKARARWPGHDFSNTPGRDVQDQAICIHPFP